MTIICKEVIQDRVNELEEAYLERNWTKVSCVIKNLKSCINISELIEELS